jgi:hypothetical protein
MKISLRPVVNFCQHPLALLFLGGLLTYIIAPMIVNGINERKLIQETKQTRALEIWNHDTQFSSKLNALKTMLESYHSQNVRLQLEPEDQKEAQKEFRRNFNQRYLELDEMAWWWYRSVQIEARDSRLVPASELPRLNADLNEYGNNVNKSIGALRPLWRALTSHDYRPNEEKSRAEFEALQKNAEDQLPDLFNERARIIDEVTTIIKTPR